MKPQDKAKGEPAVSGFQLIEITDDAAWDALVDASAQGTVFCRAAYLRALGLPVKRLAVKDGGKTVAVLPVVEDETGTRLVQPPYTPYLGILYLHAPEALRRDRVLEEFRVTEWLVAELTQRYREIGMALSWTSHDMRAFLWHNYHEADAPRFNVQPRYTALIDLEGLDRERFTAELRRARRRELKQGDDYQVSDACDAPAIERFMDLYVQTFGRQEIALPDEHLRLVRSITTAAVTEGWGRLSACITPQGVGSMNVFVYDQHRAYSLFAGNDPALRNTGAVTWLLMDNIFEAQRRGLKQLDMVGVNSPARGDWKLSFNPELTLYFQVNYSGGAAA